MKTCWFHDWKYSGYQTIGGSESHTTGPGPHVHIIVGTRMVHFKQCAKCGVEKQLQMPFICYDAIRTIANDCGLGRSYIKRAIDIVG